MGHYGLGNYEKGINVPQIRITKYFQNYNASSFMLGEEQFSWV